MFMQMGEGVDAETWEWHRQCGDYSRWIAEAIKDRELADQVAEIERSDRAIDEARAALHTIIEQRYTLPG